MRGRIGYDGGMDNAVPSAPKIRFRRLRIAWSVLAAAACIWFAGFWFRSFLFSATLSAATNGKRYQFRSERGELTFFKGSYTSSEPLSWEQRALFEWRFPPNFLGFRFNDTFSMVPYWFALLLAAAIGTVPWIRWSFSLRTMLIAVIVIAALLAFARLATFTYPA